MTAPPTPQLRAACRVLDRPADRHTPREAAGEGSALLAIAHGSSDPRAVQTLTRLVRRVRRAGPGVDVRLALLDHAAEHGLPDVASALRSLADEGAGSVVTVPLLLTPAYHAFVDLPRLLEAAREVSPTLLLTQARALGPHALLAAAGGRRLAQSGVARPDPHTAVVLAAAGSSRAGAVASVHTLARQWAGLGWRDARAAFASAAGPTVGQAVEDLLRRGSPRVVTVSYMLAPGRLHDRARHQALGAGAALVTEPLGDTPEVAALVLARYAETRGALAA